MNSSYERLPQFRLEVESMRHSIVTYLGSRHEDLLLVVNTGIDAAIKTMPMQIATEAEEMSCQAMREAMQKAITYYWEEGEGREMINDLIRKKFGASLE